MAEHRPHKPEDAGSTYANRTATEFGKAANKIDEFIERSGSARAHDPRTCKVYKCGQCAARGIYSNGEK